MATFNVTETGDVTLTFNVSEAVAYADCMDTEGGRCLPHYADIVMFARTVAHLVERKPSNWSLLPNKYLKMMGLKRFHVKSANWHDLAAYARSKEEAARMASHLRGVRVTEDKKWAEEVVA